MNRRTFLASTVGSAFLLAGCTSAESSAEEKAPTSPTAANTTRTSSETTTAKQLTASSKTESNRSGPHPIGDLTPTHYPSMTQTQKAVPFDLPTVELPEGYMFVRAAVAGSRTANSGTANSGKEYVALIYANRLNNSATNWTVVYIIHPRRRNVNFRIGTNVSIGNRTGAYYGNQQEGHLHFVCGGSEYELTGPFKRSRLVRIARSICTAGHGESSEEGYTNTSTS